MVQLQIISKILATQDFSLIDNNSINEEYFVGYLDEFKFIKEHYDKYGNIPDKSTFLSKFPNIELVEVAESDSYLLDTLREEYLYYKSVPILQKVAELLKTDSNMAIEYMVSHITELQPNYSLHGTDIIANAQERYDEFTARLNNQDNWFFTTGFPELDDVVHGINRGEELLVIFARTNQGKSWVMEKMCTHVWQLGFNVGYISPEMSPNSIGYRFDTLYKNFSNKGLMWGQQDNNPYKEYIDSLKTKSNSFIVATPIDFNRQITVSKLKQFVTQNKLDLIAVDGITYMTDERYKRGDNKTTSLTNISEDLVTLSMELNIPIIVVVQANRNGAVEENTGTPNLESIRDSDGIAHNATKVLSIRQKSNGVLEMGIKKQRFGAVGGALNYKWDIDTGNFTFIPSYDDAEPLQKTRKKVNDMKNHYSNDLEDMF